MVERWKSILCLLPAKNSTACGPTVCSKQCKQSRLLTETESCKKASLAAPDASLERKAASICYSNETCQLPSYKIPCPFCRANNRVQVGCLRNISNLEDIQCCDPECVGGCFGIGPNNCVVCKNDYMDLGNRELWSEQIF